MVSPSLPEAHRQALLHWKQGHQVFHLLLVVMNTKIEECTVYIQEKKWKETVETLHLLQILFDAATNTMVYSADFKVPLYESFIRPSMGEPFLSPGFSGLLNQDHDLMRSSLRRLGDQLNTLLGQHREAWPSAIARAWSDLGIARAYNRSRHALVCKKFVPGGDSLLQQFYRLQKPI